MVKRILILGVVLIMAFGLFTGCGGNTLKQGKYVKESNEPTDNHVWVELYDDDKFAFSRGLAISYCPMGVYTIKNAKLTLCFDDEKWIFKIRKDCLVFEKAYYNGVLMSQKSDFAKTFFAIGTEFKLSENK